ncbi:phage tail sheath protein [Novispirillum itersonii]|uniref:tail protein n=1 Tax=Novispirillum itersonii TaxID=189 RepID=UPI00037A0A29|nr:tail protein [Novispirillum itersonii]
MVTIPQTFNHGVRRVDDPSGPRPVRAVNVSVIGLVGTAPNADPAKFPLNTPVAIEADETLSAALGETGTLPLAMDAIYSLTLCAVVVVRVAEGTTDEEIENNIIGKTLADGSRTGLQALLSARSITGGLAPRAIGAPGFSDRPAVGQALKGLAERLAGWAFVDAPDTTNAAAKAYAASFASARVYNPVFGRPLVRDRAGNKVLSFGSAFALGALIRRHFERNIAWSPSNTDLPILGLSQAIDYVPGRPCEANSLNEAHVGTIINDDGVFKLWGNHSCSEDENRRFITTQVIDDFVGDSLLRAYKTRVDQPITPTFFEDLVETGNQFLSDLIRQGVILAGECWVDGDLNSWSNLRKGQAILRYKWVDPVPAEDIIVVSQIDPTLYTAVFSQ